MFVAVYAHCRNIDEFPWAQVRGEFPEVILVAWSFPQKATEVSKHADHFHVYAPDGAPLETFLKLLARKGDIAEATARYNNTHQFAVPKDKQLKARPIGPIHAPNDCTPK